MAAGEVSLSLFEVAPAQRSAAAAAKASSKRTEGCRCTARTLIIELGTLTANTMQVAEGGSTFTLHTHPTPVQQRCFELLGVTPRM